jgi:DNA replication protein DnaD
MIGAAYDVTVGATGKASVSYAGKVLAAWYEAGIKTPDEAEAHMQKERAVRSTPAARKPKKPAPPADGVHASFNVGDFFQRAIERSYNTDTKKSDT